MNLSVIIPCYNAVDTISIQLEALANQHWSEPWEIIVVNNKCTDDSMTIVEQYRKHLPNLRIVDAFERQGQPYALNVGVQAAKGRSVAFCDADDEVGPGWVAAMGEALSKYDFVACRMDTEKLNPSLAGTGCGNPQRDGLQKIRYPPNLPYAGGGTLGIKRSLFQDIGEFDESLPYLHDTDYCFRVQLAGTELRFVPDAVMHIRFRDTFAAIYRQTRLWSQYNSLVRKRYRPTRSNSVRPWISYLKSWMYLIGRLSQVRNKGGRIAWVRSFGYLVGQFHGALKYRVPPI